MKTQDASIGAFVADNQGTKILSGQSHTIVYDYKQYRELLRLPKVLSSLFSKAKVQ